MRLCFIANPESIHTRRWLRYFAERGHEVHLIGEHPTRYIPVQGVTLHDLTRQVNVRKVRYLAWAVAVRRLVRQIQPDILHAHQVASAGWLGIAAGWHPLIVTAWGSDLLLGARRSRVQRLLARWVLRRADYVTCVSEELARQACSLGADPRRVEVVLWGVDIDLFRPAAPDAALREQIGLGEGPVVLSLRALRSLYNPLDIARAIPLVLAQVPAAQFIVRTYSYDSALLAQFRALVQQAKASAAVHYVGDLSDDQAIASLYRLADVGISVPSSDGTPQSVLEAMACGVVPVVSDLPSLRPWIRPGESGLLVPVGDVRALAAAIVRLLQDEPLRRQMRDRGVELINQRVASAVSMQHVEFIYLRLARGVPKVRLVL